MSKSIVIEAQLHTCILGVYTFIYTSTMLCVKNIYLYTFNVLGQGNDLSEPPSQRSRTSNTSGKNTYGLEQPNIIVLGKEI